jgi:hypothetical protein
VNTLEEQIALLNGVASKYSKDPDVNQHGDLDAVVEAQHELLRQKEDPSYKISIEMRAKVATVVQWARKVEAFKKSGNPAGRPFDLLALLDAKAAADQKLKPKENANPSLNVGKK